MPRLRTAGIDASSSVCRVVVRDGDTGELLRTGRATIPSAQDAALSSAPPGCADPVAATRPEAWWHALLAAIDDADGFRDVSALSLVGPDHTLVTLDPEGRPVSPVLRGDRGFGEAATALSAELAAAAATEGPGAETDGLVAASSMLAKIRWLRENEPTAAERIDAVMSVLDWLIWRLRGFGAAGESPHGARLEELVTGIHSARQTGFWNAETGRWDHRLVARALGHSPIKPRVMTKPDAWGGETAKLSEQGIRLARIIGIGLTPSAARELAGQVFGTDSTHGDDSIPGASALPDTVLADAAAAQACWARTHRLPDWA